MSLRPKLDQYPVLAGEQRFASDPAGDVWLSASAGTGKTFVLTSRVLRLLLSGVRPDTILCLTFTKAGAAEMATRVHERLAWWVRLDERLLSKELFALGDPHDAPACARARTLFAEVLDARGGGLRIMTIHAFCQTLLASFPFEAGLIPGFRAIEGREADALARQVLSDLVVTAEREGDARLIAALRTLSRRLGEEETRAYLIRATGAVDALAALTDGLDARIRRAFDVPADYSDASLAEDCGEEAIDRQSLDELATMLRAWGGARGAERAERLETWLAATPDERARTIDRLQRVWCKDGGTPFAGAGWIPRDPNYQALTARLDAWCRRLSELRQRSELARDCGHALHAARRFAMAYADAKRRSGFVDFDDLIRHTLALLTAGGIGAWIAYKLDQTTDHILVDEAQDTNVAQWSIVAALTSEFWAGAGAKGTTPRTLFTVGDYKQAIFGFQGTDPRHYAGAEQRFAQAADDAGRELVKLSLARSFRSTPPVLDVVDALLEELGPDRLGTKAAEAHASARGGGGQVMLLPPVSNEQEADAEDEEGWIESATRLLARRIAEQVRDWLDMPLMIEARGGRALQPGDVMILVRRRSDLAALLVARLQAAGVPVAGVDRLRLSAPLAVQDCLAALRFAVQPDDDLNLAALLVSPLIGWTQERLFEVAHGREGRLWHALRQSVAAADLAPLSALLALADRVTPFVYLETLLSGPLGGRRKLIDRLGEEARDPVDELLNAALMFESEGVPSLQGFLDWFDRGTGEVVRDPGDAGNAVRVMTVHAAKGLQAPLVIIADAASDPDDVRARDFDWFLDDLALPLFRPRAGERQLVASLAAAATDAADQDRREHWRLLYVAMTRAEERLVIAGALGKRNQAAPAASWHAAVERALARLDAAVVPDDRWGPITTHGSPRRLRPKSETGDPIGPACPRPAWLDQPAPPEEKPERPLTPSALGPDLVAQPPAAGAEARARGRMIHALFERLPALPVDRRRQAADAYLDRAGPLAAREEIRTRVFAVLDDAAFSWLFAPGGLAEVPLAGVVDGITVAGTVDRLVVGPDALAVVDFKTGRRVPRSPDAIPDHHLAQMAAYGAVLAQVFPGRKVTAGLLYTEGPVLHLLPPALLARHKPGLGAAEHKLPAAG